MPNSFDPSLYQNASSRVLDCNGCGDEGIVELTFVSEFLYFDLVEMGSSSSLVPVIVTNTGSLAVSVLSIAVTGDFSFVGTTPWLMEPGSTHTFMAQFTPTGLGVRLGDVVMTTNPDRDPVTLRLIGVGHDMVEGSDTSGPAIEALQIQLANLVISFGNLTTNTNASIASLVVDSLQATLALRNELAAVTGAGMVSTASGSSVQEAIDYLLLNGGGGGGGGPGTPGTNGLNAARPVIYKRSLTAPALPTAQVTLTFATGVLANLNNGWTVGFPEPNGQPLWVSAASATALTPTAAIEVASWAAPVKLLQDGNDGDPGASAFNQATVRLYRRLSNSPTKPSAQTIYTFATGALEGLNNNWSRTIPPANGNPVWTTEATVISLEATDTIEPTEWAAPVILAQDGLPGLAGTDGLHVARPVIYKRSATLPDTPTVEVMYNFVTGQLTGLDNGWTVAFPPDDGNPLWGSGAAASSITSSDAIPPGEWADPVILLEPAVAGDVGPSGLSQATVSLYRRSAGTPVLPSTDVTYLFADASVSGANNGWTKALPANNGSPLWMTQAAAISNGASDVITPANWSPAQVLVQNGAPGTDGSNGLNTARILIYRRSATVPALPTEPTTYTFATSALAGLVGWTTTIPAADGNPLYVSGASAAGAGATDTIAAAEWAAPVILAQDGTPGAGGTAGLNQATVRIYRRAAAAPTLPTAVANYTFASGAVTGLNNSWTTTVPPVNGDPLWTAQATAISTAANDTIPASEWSAVVVMVQDGVNGTDGTDGTNGSNSIVAETTGIPSPVISCTVDSVPKAGQLTAAGGTMRLRSGSSGLVTAGVTAFAVQSQVGCIAAINAVTGVYSFSSISAVSANATFQCTYLGVTYTLRVPLTKVLDGADANEFVDAVVIGALTSTTYPAANAEQVDIEVVIPAGKTLSILSVMNYVARPLAFPGVSGAYNYIYVGKMKVTTQNMTDGGAEVDLASVTGGSASYSLQVNYELGYPPNETDTPSSATINSSITNSGSVSKFYIIRAYLAKSSGDSGDANTTLKGTLP